MLVLHFVLCQKEEAYELLSLVPPYVQSLAASLDWSTQDNWHAAPLQDVEAVRHNFRIPLDNALHADPVVESTRSYPE